MDNRNTMDDDVGVISWIQHELTENKQMHGKKILPYLRCELCDVDFYKS